MESYVVRIYRRDVDGGVAGVIEDALSRRKKAFHSVAELADWLRRPRRPTMHPTPNGVLDPDAQKRRAAVPQGKHQSFCASIRERKGESR